MTLARTDPREIAEIPALDRYKVNPATGCWIFLGLIDRDGYGRINHLPAHRYFYQQLVGPIPEGHELDHLCVRRACVNPDHLEPVTQDENRRRSREYLRPAAWRSETCTQGHEYTPETLRIQTISRPGGVIYFARICRICDRATRRAAAERKRQQE